MEVNKLNEEIESFKNLWKGGYFVGNPLDPMGHSDYLTMGFMSVLYVTYLCCIRPYVNTESIVLEIGPGRGPWTKAFLELNCKEIWCLDALSAEHNKFYDYIGRQDNVKYFQVNDFSCNMLPEDYFSYLFSFGCFCHISFEGIKEYMVNLYPKLKKGAQCFIMIADYEKYNNALRNIEHISAFRSLPKSIYYSFKWVEYLYNRFILKKYRMKLMNLKEDKNPYPGRWYNAGIDRMCNMLEYSGYNIIQKDMLCNHRDPIIYFLKK